MVKVFLRLLGSIEIYLKKMKKWFCKLGSYERICLNFKFYLTLIECMVDITSITIYGNLHLPL